MQPPTTDSASTLDASGGLEGGPKACPWASRVATEQLDCEPGMETAGATIDGRTNLSFLAHRDAQLKLQNHRPGRQNHRPWANLFNGANDAPRRSVCIE